MVKNPFLAIDKRILGDSGTSGEAEMCLHALCDEIGTRFAGTEGYRRAAEFMLDRFKAYKLDKAYLEPFELTGWRRGAPATFKMIKPRSSSLDCYELPYSAATDEGGVEAQLVDIGGGSEKEVKAKSRKIEGNLVLTTSKGGHRTDVYRRCVRNGAVGFVFISAVKGGGLATGTITNATRGRIPAISITAEDAVKLQRKIKRGKPSFHLVTHGECDKMITWNVVGELRGTERPGELVLMGGHLDSHEVGPGAFDNAAGAVEVVEAARLLAKQRKHLKRTVRFICFAAEEIGLLGSHYHAKKHAASMKKARFMLNSDCPSMSRPKGLVFHRKRKAKKYIEMLSGQMQTPIVYREGFHRHSDHYPFYLKGLLTAGMVGGRFGSGVQHYMHMAGDTSEKISIIDLREGAAFAAQVLLRASSDEKWMEK